MTRNKIVIGRRIGRKNSAQLFLFFYSFTDGFCITALRNVHFGNLFRVPDIGHTGAFSSPCTVFFLPAFIHGLCIQFAGFAPGVAWCVAIICRSSGIRKPSDWNGIECKRTVMKFNELGQRNFTLSNNQGSMCRKLQGIASGCAFRRRQCQFPVGRRYPSAF